MDILDASTRFAALSLSTRLEVVRLLVRQGKSGLLAGEIATALSVRQNTMSAHLGHLEQAKLIRSQREGRNVRYMADMDGMRALLAFLLEDCCGGAPGECSALLDDVCCPC